MKNGELKMNCTECFKSEIRTSPNGKRNDPIHYANTGKKYKPTISFICSHCIQKLLKRKPKTMRRTKTMRRMK